MKRVLLVMTVCMAGLLSSCGNVTSDPVEVNITRHWTATGDDAAVGTATTYDGRWSLSVDSLQNHWGDCSIWQGIGSKVPLPSGSVEEHSFSVTVESEVPFYTALKAADERDNWSGLSNIVEHTVPDTIPPLAITDLW